MWGNRLGWSISAGIVLVTIGIYAMLLSGGGYAKPTAMTTKAGAMDPLQLPGNPRSLVPAGSGGDATSLYAEAVSAYKSNPSLYDQYEKSGKLTDAGKLPAVAAILKASQTGPGKIYSSNPESVVVHGGRRYGAIKSIEIPGRCVMRIGNLYVAQKKPQEAKKYFEAAFNLGYAMYSERLTYPEFMRGMELMRTAALSLASIDEGKAAAYRDFDQAGKDFFTALKFPTLFNPADRRVVDRNSGDVFNLALNSKERMWRVEAILMLGHFRHFATHAGDQRGAERVLKQLAADPTLDPAVMAAVKASQGLTLADHNTSAQMPD